MQKKTIFGILVYVLMSFIKIIILCDETVDTMEPK